MTARSDALQQLRARIAAEPGDSSLYTQLGLALFRNDQLVEALEAWERAYGNYATTFSTEASTREFIARRLQEFDSARMLECALGRLDLASEDEAAWYEVVAHATFALGLFPQAFVPRRQLSQRLRSARARLDRRPGDAVARFELAVCMLYTGQPGETVAELAHLIESDGKLGYLDNLGGLHAFASACTHLKRGENSETLAREVRAMRTTPV